MIRKRAWIPLWLIVLMASGTLFSCTHTTERLYPEADSLNVLAYDLHYKNLAASNRAASQALKAAGKSGIQKAEAYNNLAFCAFMKMDFERSERLFHQVYDETNSELECLIADVGLMKISQRTAMNKEFYDYRNSALRRIKRIKDDYASLSTTHELDRFQYGETEFYLITAIYHYYLQQEQQAAEAIAEIKLEGASVRDSAQLLYTYYLKGVGMIRKESFEERTFDEFNYLLDLLRISNEQGYLYFEANASQALSELFQQDRAYAVLQQRRPHILRMINPKDLSQDSLMLTFAQRALNLFNRYGDFYQISGAYRTLSSCYTKMGEYQQALTYLTEALSYVNLHHETYYHCTDTTDRLRPYDSLSTHALELQWITEQKIKTIPEWIARLREQLSMNYAAMGMKPESDYNRNIYLDILDYTRQDKELLSRYNALEKESKQLNVWLSLVIGGGFILFFLLVWFNRSWRNRNEAYIAKLKSTLAICKRITASVPAHASELEDVVEAIRTEVGEELMQLLGAERLEFHCSKEEINASLKRDEEQLEEEESATNFMEEEDFITSSVSAQYSELESEEEKLQMEGFENEDADSELRVNNSALSQKRYKQSIFPLYAPDNSYKVGDLYIYSTKRLDREVYSLMKVIAPYMAWTLENGLAIIQLGDERKRLEKEQYVWEQRLAENKRQNVMKRACLFLVTGITPYMDRIINEVHKLVRYDYVSDKEVRREKFLYVSELVGCINEYNEMLTRWIQMRQGSLSLSIEAFEIQPLFDLLQKGRKTYEMKQQTLQIAPTTACVKADKALTLFMLNTLAENARKYTQAGGTIQLSAIENEEYVELAVEDNGPGLSPSDVELILSEKIYDSTRIGLESSSDREELMQHKGGGFGLMNCKGVIEKYRKTNELFRVCTFSITSELGKGSRFSFRLPKGVKRAWIWMLLFLSIGAGCQSGEQLGRQMEPTAMGAKALSVDSLLMAANGYANQVYRANVDGRYQEALVYADSAFHLLNRHYQQQMGLKRPYLTLQGEGRAAELFWLSQQINTDYYTLLDVRNEAAVAFLALGNLDAYRYNNNAYTTLYKQLSEDVSLEEYCRKMQVSSTNKSIAIVLCFILLFLLLVGYYVLYLRKNLFHQYSLEQVLNINKRAFQTLQTTRLEIGEVAKQLVDTLFQEVNELVAIHQLGIAIYGAEDGVLHHAFSHTTDENEALQEVMARCFVNRAPVWRENSSLKALPLWIETGGERSCIGVLALQVAPGWTQEDDRIMLELVAGYVAVLAHTALVLMEQKYRDVESANDEARRVQREENQLHVQNLVLDNCLSTIKHETVYYPNKVKQLIEKLDHEEWEAGDLEQVETIGELMDYYKSVFTLLASCASRQLEEVTFRRGTLPADELATYAQRYWAKLIKRQRRKLTLAINAEEVWMVGDAIQLKLLLECLLNEAVSYSAEGALELTMREAGDFVRFDFTDRRRTYTQAELNLLFFPQLNRMQSDRNGMLSGTEFLISKQIIREHDEFAGRRGCRINAEPAKEGVGYTIWFTIPRKKKRN